MADQKNPKEASNLFHRIMKASMSPKATGGKVAKTDRKEIKPKPKK